MQRKAFELEQGILPVDPAELADGEEEDEDEDEDDVVVTASSSNKATKYEIVAAADKALKMLPSTSSALEKSRAIANTICSLKGLPSALSLNETKVTHSLTHRLTHSLTGLLTHSLAYLLTHLLTHLGEYDY